MKPLKSRENNSAPNPLNALRKIKFFSVLLSSQLVNSFFVFFVLSCFRGLLGLASFGSDDASRCGAPRCFINLIITFATMIFLACSPERDNPYDPKSDFYTNKTQISGYCKNRMLVPINNATISLFPLRNETNSFQTFTNENGAYRLTNCPAESVLVIAEKEDFVAESVYLVLNSYKTETLNFTLEGLPQFLSTTISSYCIKQIPTDSVVLSVKCEVKDDESQSDIASVFSTILGLPDTLPLLFKSGYVYENSFAEESLSSNLDNIVGKAIFINAVDRFGNQVTSAKLNLIRIIRNPPEIISPAGGEIVSFRPLLVWSKRQYLFSHSFFCEIYRVPYPLPPVLYCRYENILTDDTTFQVNDSLINNYYYWQIGVRDNYGNWAKSAEGFFEVR